MLSVSVQSVPLSPAETFDRKPAVSLIRGLLGSEAPQAGPAPEERGVVVDLGLCSLADFLGIIGPSDRPGVIHLVSPHLEGTIHLLGDGRFVARAGALRGIDAMVALLQPERGSIRYRQSPAEPPAGEPLAVQDALLQQAWIHDELLHRNGSVPDDDDLVAAEPEALPPAAHEEAGLPLRRLFDLVASGPPIRVAELARAGICAPQRLRLALARLIESGRLVRQLPGPGAQRSR
ncbi:MAG TPA: DUF4388 domain-containing protein [Thermoanaerobaculia bacterium]|nr:DUF4388 domain-containing protein [Thermoanaerobaculia bacterium]